MYEEYIRAWRRRFKERAERETVFQESSRRALDAYIPGFAHKWDLDRVWLFGSLARGTATLDSDADLAVEDLRPRDYLSAFGDLENDLPIPCDLVRLEDAPRVRARVEREGVLLYERADAQ